MNFFDAMKELEKGNKVRNDAWKEGKYLYKDNKKICFSDAGIVKCLDSYDLNYGTWELYKESILNEEEKEYLNNVIKPFKNRVCYIIKYESTGFNNEEYIQICGKSYDRYIKLSTFVRGSMYNNMKLAKGYSLKELGLDE